MIQGQVVTMEPPDTSALAAGTVVADNSGMDIRQLQYFLAIVDHGGFHRAADSLFVSQPSLSQAVRSLERDLGSALFDRVGTRVLLTQAGSALLEPARAAVRSLETARASVTAVQELRSGRLDIAAMPSPAIEPLTDLVERFACRYPGVSVAIRAAFTPRDVIDMVRTGTAELGLLTTAEPLPTKHVTAHVIGEQRLVLLAPHDSPLPIDRPVATGELRGQRLIVVQHGTAGRAFIEALRRQGLDFTIAVETEHRVSILPLVIAGVGLAVVTDSWRQVAIRAGVLVLDLEPNTRLQIALISRRDPLSPAARAFVATSTGEDVAAAPPAVDR